MGQDAFALHVPSVIAIFFGVRFEHIGERHAENAHAGVSRNALHESRLTTTSITYCGNWVIFSQKMPPSPPCCPRNPLRPFALRPHRGKWPPGLRVLWREFA